MAAWAWEWDEPLYAGGAPHYAVGRMPYPAALAHAVWEELGLDGTGRLLDVGCGPGSLTLLQAPFFPSAVGIDADPDMIAEARRAANSAGIHNVEWHQMRAEELPADRGTFRLVTFAQSFHWMNQEVVAQHVREMLSTDGARAQVFATTHRGVDAHDDLPHPRPPWDRIDELIARYLGPVRRAGQDVLPTGTRSGEEDVMKRVGFIGPKVLEVKRGEVINRRLDEVVSAVFSLSGSTHTCSATGSRHSRRTSDGSCGSRRLPSGSRNASATSLFCSGTREPLKPARRAIADHRPRHAVTAALLGSAHRATASAAYGAFQPGTKVNYPVVLMSGRFGRSLRVIGLQGSGGDRAGRRGCRQRSARIRLRRETVSPEAGSSQCSLSLPG